MINCTLSVTFKTVFSLVTRKPLTKTKLLFNKLMAPCFVNTNRLLIKIFTILNSKEYKIVSGFFLKKFEKYLVNRNCLKDLNPNNDSKILRLIKKVRLNFLVILIGALIFLFVLFDFLKKV